MARWVLLLLAVFAAGFLLGRLTGDDGGDVARAPPAQRQVGRPRPPAGAPHETLTEAPVESATTPGETPAASADVVPPGPADPMADADTGILDVDFAGTAAERTAWVGYVDMRGGYESWDENADQDSDTVRFDLIPGVYDVWWLDAEDGRRRGTRARVDAGHVTAVRVTDHHQAPPVPEGLGILDLRVAASWGGGMSVDVAISSHLEDTEIYTNGLGLASTALAPGRYAIRVGDNESEAIVERGRATLHRVQHRDEGDLIVEVLRSSDLICIVPAGEPIDSGRPLGDFLGPAERLFPYLSAGEYDAYYRNGPRDGLGVDLGRIRVRPGETTRFRYELPRGGIALRVIEKERRIRASWWATVRAVGHSEGVLQIHDAFPDLAHHVALSCGRYVVTVLPNGGDPQVREVDVGDSMVPVRIDLATPTR